VSPEVREALDSACSVATAEPSLGRPARRRGFGGVRALVYAVVQELPGEMTLAELCDELCNGAAQALD